MFRMLLFGVIAVSARVCAAHAATPEATAAHVSVEVTRRQLTALRDTFVKQAQATGIKCAVPPPTIVVHDVPSYGSYDPDTNTLTSPAWRQLSKQERSIFYRSLPSGTNSKEAAEAEFEIGVHHWVIVHELGHWWEACRKMVDHGDHYEFELVANKIAAAYWNESDPSVNAHQKQLFEQILEKWPNPVPVGQAIGPYLNANYEKLGPTPAYIWFQAQMCTTALAQNPVPAFAAALAEVPEG